MGQQVCTGAMTQCTFGVAPRLADGDSRQHGDGRWPARSQHHGQQAHGQRHALWNVPVPGQPDGGRRHGRCAGCPDPYALYSHDHGALATWRADRIAGQHACTEQQLKTDVHVGWRDFHQCARPIHGDGALIP